MKAPFAQPPEHTGDYQFIDAKAGHYSLGSRTGFEKWQTTGVMLASRQQLRIDVKLVVGSVQQEVQVSADTITAINTETSFDQRRVYRPRRPQICR